MKDCDGMVLCCDIVQILWATINISKIAEKSDNRTHYFSTHGCIPRFSFGCTDFAAFAPFCAASLRALRSKKLAMINYELFAELLQFYGEVICQLQLSSKMNYVRFWETR